MIVLLLKTIVAAIALWTAILLWLLYVFIYKATRPSIKDRD